MVRTGKMRDSMCDVVLKFSFPVIVLGFIRGIVSLQHNTISKQCANERQIAENGSFVITFTNGKLEPHSNILSNDFSSSCTIFVTKPEFRLSAKLRYDPSKHDCHHGYISIGNDKFRPDVPSMTSYKFCERVEDIEIVSRSNILWIMNKRRFGHKVKGQIEVESRLAVHCNESWYECSPLQCVAPSALCNGVRDCENGRDEFCNTNISEECFLCDDGTCISPTLPRYHYNWGKSYWYICDGFKHCRDGSDEREDKCQEEGQMSKDLIMCLYHKNSHPIATWHIDHCITKNGCLAGFECGENADISDIRGSAIAITVCAFVIVLSCCTFIFVKSGKRKRKRRGPPERMTSRCQLYRDGSASRVATHLHSSEAAQQT